MPAYLIVYREGPVRDPEAMTEYQSRTRQMTTEQRPTPLVIHGAIQPVEGQPPEGVILLQFPTAADARAWYDSPGYQAALPYRLKAADYRVIIVEGL
jgi:uncharacterized protein (DUF1330 family)